VSIAAPILYLAGVARDTLRAAEDCPPLLQPLLWFTVAGSLFGHVNGKDWTLRGFLAAEKGRSKLDVPDDAATRAALAHAPPRFCSRPMEELRGKRWDADALKHAVGARPFGGHARLDGRHVWTLCRSGPLCGFRRPRREGAEIRSAKTIAVNAGEEKRLREELTKVADLAHSDACARLQALEKAHA
jgi:hypothetical protein